MTIVESMLEIVRRRERKPVRPRQRDEAIYAQVRVEGRTQAAVAAEHGVSQPRISQIVRRVDDWRRCEEFASDTHDDQAPQRRVDRALDRQRLEEAYVRGMRAQQRAERASVTTERSGERDGKPWSEKSTREQGVNVQGLKSALRAIEMLWKLEDRPQGTSNRRNAVQQLEDAVEQLCYVRKCALGYAGIRNAEPPEATVARLVEELLRVGPAKQDQQSNPACQEPSSAEPLEAEPCWDLGDCPYPPAADRSAYAPYAPAPASAEPPREVATRPLVPTADAAASCTAKPQPKPPLESWIIVPVKKPDISPPLTPAQREARRQLLPKMELVEYDEHGKEIRRW